jgi:hypothetical protein
MNRFYYILFTSLLTTALAFSLSAQRAFDVKKKTASSVDKSSLGAVHIQGQPSSRMTSKTSIPSKSIVGQNVTFPQSLLQKRKDKVFYSRETGLPSFITTTNNEGQQSGDL